MQPGESDEAHEKDKTENEGEEEAAEEAPLRAEEADTAQSRKCAVAAMVGDAGHAILDHLDVIEGSLAVDDKFANFVRTTREQQQQQQAEFLEMIELVRPEEFSVEGTSAIASMVGQWRENLIAQLNMLRAERC